jgi:hypothetical protein
VGTLGSLQLVDLLVKGNSGSVGSNFSLDVSDSSLDPVVKSMGNSHLLVGLSGGSSGVSKVGSVNSKMDSEFSVGVFLTSLLSFSGLSSKSLDHLLGMDDFVSKVE